MSFLPVNAKQAYLQQSENFPEDPEQLRTKLTDLYTQIATATNVKEIGFYNLQETINGQQFFTSTNQQNRLAFRKVVNFGALPNTASKSVAHGISFTSSFSCTRIYSCASDSSGFNYIPLPYASSTAANCIELSLTSTNVVITTGSNRSNFTICYVIIEYLKN